MKSPTISKFQDEKAVCSIRSVTDVQDQPATGRRQSELPWKHSRIASACVTASADSPWLVSYVGGHSAFERPERERNDRTCYLGSPSDVLGLLATVQFLSSLPSSPKR
ncbi:hypothetical protein ACRALDRAFT_2038278 [Sodiomyces alcalophilus JCM 7366]|uniref:uncharacterized protein n=1 Tax=Sodiomyces alcalophilus JCM 7366 TaxID=591952 RepID=UPI0039B6C621